MASISSLTSSSSTSGLYGTSNVISGLASGLDTETLIENSVSGYKSKITGFQQEQQMITWKQDAYRSLIDKMVSMTKKYTSYTSSTNLFSASFFNNAVSTTSNGAFADMVSATGKTSSDIQINAIKQLATAAKYTVGLGSINTGVTESEGRIIATGEAMNLSEPVNVSNVSGSMTFKYGNKNVSISFAKDEIFTSAQDMADAINEKLAEENITVGDKTYKASERIQVDVNSETGEISFSDKADAGNSVYISSLTGDIGAGSNGLSISQGETATSFQVTDPTAMSGESTFAEYIAGKTMSFTLDGSTKRIELPDLAGLTGDGITDELVSSINDQLADKFGSGKITAAISDGALTFSVAKGSTLSVNSEGANAALGLGENGVTNYLNTSAKLGDILGSFAGLEDDATQDLVINGVTIGSFTKDTALESVMTAINSNTEAGVKMSYSKLTNQFTFTASETGAAGKIEFDNGTGTGLASELFGGGVETQGQDAVFTATVNGADMELTRSTNVVDIDGLSVTLKGAFGYEGDNVIEGTEAVSFTTKSDSDTVVDAIKSFVEDYNTLAKELRSAYATQPATKSDHSRYKPLTDDDKADMTDSAIEKYEEKVKQGILFGDADLSALYSSLRSIITPSGSDGNALNSIGITTNYEDGLTTLSLDENTLRNALEADPDKVRDTFIKTKETGASTDGIMTKLKTTLEKYSSTSIANTGILVKRAGTSLSAVSLLNNTLQSQIDDLDDQIERWQDKLSDKIDFYTSKFTALEQLISSMNNQSSMLAGLTG